MKRGKKIFFLFFLSVVIILGSSLNIYAHTNDNASISNNTNEIDKRIKEENKELYERLKEGNQNISEKDKKEFNQMLNAFGQEERTRITGSNVADTFMLLAVNSRRFIVPAYIVFVFYCIIKISTLGAKSLKNRKKYILGIVFFTVLFIFLFNLPLFILYFQHTPLQEVFSFENIIKMFYSFVDFMQKQSYHIAALLMVYGIVNLILSKNDIPRRLLGQFLLKFAGISFIVLQFLPLAIKYIL